MDNLLLSLNIVAPLIFFMTAGYLLHHFGGIHEKTFTQLSRIVFYLCIPALCCDSLRTLDLVETFSDPTGLYIAVAVLVLYALAVLIVPRFCHSSSRRGVLIAAVFRSNDAVFAIPIATALLNEASMGLMMLCVAITILLYNILAVVTMEYYRSGELRLGKALFKLTTNPVIIGCLMGILLGILHIPLPAVIAKPLSSLAACCTPLGFLALGGGLSFRLLSENRLAISVTSLFKLLIVPAVVIVVLYLTGMPSDVLLIGMVIFGAPTAMSVYPMACTMGGDPQLAGGLVAITSALSPITMFLFIFTLMQVGVI